jgi:ABC-type polysaccharide/polyol phosphate transport system ATPase subunit
VSEPAIELRGVGKRYWKVQERSLLRSLVPLGTPNRTHLWALHDVDLRVEAGETVGIIGRNGAGKSTMLRLLAGVSRPTTGTVVTRGRVAPLLSVGVGFHAEMTGRENVYVNGMLLGLDRPRIDALFDDIVGFAELGDFIDTPVKFYSSGMFMRLGFSVAMHSEPDILLVDEVLAVGDIGFRVRSFDRMRELHRNGTALVFVSHWLEALQVLCPRAVCIDRGHVEFDGPTEGAIARHYELLGSGGTVVHQDRTVVHIVDRDLLDGDGISVRSVHQDQRVTYRVTLRFETPVESPQILFQMFTEDGTPLYHAQTPLAKEWRSFGAGEEATVEAHFLPRFGGGGTFRPAVVVNSTDASSTLLLDKDGPRFFVQPRFGVLGVSDLDASIVVDDENRTDRASMRFASHPSPIEGT